MACDTLLKILSYLPEKVRTAILSDTFLCENLCEIRLRRGCYVSCTLYRENRFLDILLSEKEIYDILLLLCEGSLYSFSESLRHGYITRFGCRIGVSGKAFCEKDQAGAFSEIFSLNIRIPRFIENADKALLSHICSFGFGSSGILVASAPGGGKTTLLKALAYHLSSGISYLGKMRTFRVLLADTREELFCERFKGRCAIDVLSGFERAKSIEMGIRTLCPEIIIADEIGGKEDARSILDAYLYGCVLIASCHATSLEQIYAREYMRRLLDTGIFKTVYIIKNDGSVFDGELIQL